MTDMAASKKFKSTDKYIFTIIDKTSKDIRNIGLNVARVNNKAFEVN